VDKSNEAPPQTAETTNEASVAAKLRYEDTLQKTGAGWRFKRRIFHFDVNLVPAQA